MPIEVQRDTGLARGHQDAAEIGIAAEERGLDQRRVRDLRARRDRRRRRCARLSPRSSPVWSRLRRRAPVPARARRHLRARPLRSWPDRGRRAPISRRATRHQQQRIVGRHVAVDSDRVETVRQRAFERAPELRRLDGGVGHDEGEHRRHLRLDHAGAFGAARNGHFRAASLTVAEAIFGCVSVVMIARREIFEAIRRERRDRVATPARYFADRKRCPITPVEHGATNSVRQPIALRDRSPQNRARA